MAAGMGDPNMTGELGGGILGCAPGMLPLVAWPLSQSPAHIQSPASLSRSLLRNTQATTLMPRAALLRATRPTQWPALGCWTQQVGDRKKNLH